MTDFIYPECPHCETVASEGEGIRLRDLAARFEWKPHPRWSNRGSVRWTCSNCLYTHHGYWEPDMHSVEWEDTRFLVRDRLLMNLRSISGLFSRSKTESDQKASDR